MENHKEYRLAKRNSWWTCLFDTSSPQFLYYDLELERFEVGSIGACQRRGRWKFSEEEVEQMRKDYNLDDEFLVEEVKRSKDERH